MQVIKEFLDTFFSDVGVFDAICVTFQMAFCATGISSVLGILLGLLLERADFVGKKVVIRINRTLMGVPPVVVGLVVYMLLMRRGPLGRYKILVYVFSGLCMGLSALIMGSRIVLVTQESGGNSLMMDAIAAAVIGGTDINGGKGSMLGTFLGVIFIGVINNMLVFLSIPSAAQELFKGMLIIAALFLNLLARKE